ncbi:MAG: hypothetical protein RLY14_2125, partial [Planctomycetota bacterium]
MKEGVKRVLWFSGERSLAPRNSQEFLSKNAKTCWNESVLLSGMVTLRRPSRKRQFLGLVTLRFYNQFVAGLRLVCGDSSTEGEIFTDGIAGWTKELPFRKMEVFAL